MSATMWPVVSHSAPASPPLLQDKNEQLVITCVDHSTLPTMTLIRGMAKTLLVSILDERLCAVVGPMPSFDADHYEVQVSRPVRTMSAPGGAASASSKPAAGPKPHSSVPCNPPCEQCQYLPNTPASPTVLYVVVEKETW